MSETFEYKSIDGQTPTSVVDRKQGIVECFVAAIGNKDSVGDIIQPGAFSRSLKGRKPRVVWGHDWNQPIGKVLEVYEVGPHDPRLPMKMKMAGVGGLYARVQFNLNSSKGKDAFEDILFYGEDQEWSIGYKTLVSTFDPGRKANLLKEVELYEMSPVLHGANQLTSTISIKSAEDPATDEAIRKGLARTKTFFDDNPDLAQEIAEAEIKDDSDGLELKINKPSSDFRGEIAGGRGPRRGGLEDLLKYWRPIMKKPGGFRRCLVILADHPELGPDHRRICAWLHHETTGKWPNEGHHHPGMGRRGKSLETEINIFTSSGLDEAVLAKAVAEAMSTKVALTEVSEKSVSFIGDDDTEYEANYVKSDDEFLFGTKKLKKHPCKDGGPCECGGTCQTEKSLEDEQEEKIGRRISGGNMAKLQQALSLLQEVVSSGAIVDVEMKEVVVKGGTQGLKSALDTVNEFHNPEIEIQWRSEDDAFHVAIKSLDHFNAIKRVTEAFEAELREVQ